MTTNVERMRRIVAHADLASTTSGQWAALLAELKILFDARGVVLFTPEPGPEVEPMSIAQGDVVDGMAPYFADWAHQDAWNTAVAGTGFYQNAGDARFGHEFLPDDVLKATGFFNDWARRYHAEQLVSLKVTDALDRTAPVMHLTLFRRFADPSFDKRDRLRLQLLWPALRRAAQATTLLRRASHGEGRAVEDVLDALPLACWVVREGAHVEFANRMARDVTRAGVWARAEQGRLCAIGHLDALDLDRCIGQAVPCPHRGGQASAISIECGGRIQRGLLRALPISEVAIYAAAWPRARALLMLEMPPSAEHGALWRMHLAERYRLTPAQARVLDELARGATVHAIAASLGIRVGTVRAHVHELLAKTGQSRQADLVRLVTSG